ncbi:MAG: Lrp/AsnC family transcriptional regulator [Lysobacterales bacterium]
MFLDRHDQRLLDLLQQNNQQTYQQLGDQLGLSDTAMRRRARRLRADGVISADVSLVDPAKLGVTVIVSIRFEKESHETYAAFKKQMAACKPVSQCYTVSGEVDFMLIAHFQDLEKYDAWVGNNILNNPNIARSTTNVVYTRVKFDTAIPIESGHSTPPEAAG